ncbi:MAG TPA: amino acid ABC transporter permease [Caldilineaceae bacterium]|nr:amino acid ABC transporter permease [Caldilineaceae bacterium]
MSVHSVEVRPPVARRHWLARVPYWLVVALALALWFLWFVSQDANYTVIFQAVVAGVATTLWVTLVAYTGALVLGLIIGLLRIARNRFLWEATSFYVEIVRGIPILVLLYYIAFVGAPGLVDGINWLGIQLSGLGLVWPGEPLANFSVRQLDFVARAILALIIGYSAFISEIFRAGIESIDKGQSEAALSLGMSRWQTLRLVILPQAVRRVLPPLGNDFIAMLKDSALVSALGVQDITRLGNSYAASTFRYFETYNVVAFLYLAMTVGLALVVRYLERRVPNR